MASSETLKFKEQGEGAESFDEIERFDAGQLLNAAGAREGALDDLDSLRSGEDDEAIEEIKAVINRYRDEKVKKELMNNDLEPMGEKIDDILYQVKKSKKAA